MNNKARRDVIMKMCDSCGFIAEVEVTYDENKNIISKKHICEKCGFENNITDRRRIKTGITSFVHKMSLSN